LPGAEKMLDMVRCGRGYGLKSLALGLCFAAGGGAWAAEGPSATLVSNSSISVALRAGEHAPRIAWIGGSALNTWSNAEDDPLPATVETGGAQVPVTWQLKPELGSVDGHERHIVMVYETAEPHLRLKWEW